MIHSFEFSTKKIGDVGRVCEIKGSLVKTDDLKNSVIGEVVVFENELHGIVSAILNNGCEIMVFSSIPLEVGVKVARTGQLLSVTVGDGLLTHVIDPLGHVVDERRHESTNPESRFVMQEPLGIQNRTKINKFLTTGVTVVDLMTPLGEGQRELIIGDRKSGKSFFILQTVVNQAKLGKICILGLIGKRKEEIKRIEQTLEKEKVIDKCIIVASSSSDSAGEIYLTPYTTMTVAEYFRDQGKDTLVVLDDMTTHAKYYREISLLAGRFPGRESYPGDVFYAQSQIIERAGNFLINKKEVSITLLPIAETQEADLTGYIQTNLMSMTDGHIFFDSNLFFAGARPAVNIFLSVTRVGKQTQPILLKQAGIKTLELLKKCDDLERFTRFGSEVIDQVKLTIEKGAKIREFFKQGLLNGVDYKDQVILLALIFLDKWDGETNTPDVKKYRNSFDSTNNFNDLLTDLKYEIQV